MSNKWYSVNENTIADLMAKNEEKSFKKAVKSGVVPNTLQGRAVFQTGTAGVAPGLISGGTLNGKFMPGGTFQGFGTFQNPNGAMRGPVGMPPTGFPPGGYPSMSPGFNPPTPQILTATDIETSIVGLVLKKEFPNLLQLLLNYNNMERFDFWRNYIYNGKAFKSIIMESIADYSRPMYIGTFFGGEYYDAAVLFEALEKRKEKLGLGIITFFKNIKKRTPFQAFPDLFGKEVTSYVSSRTDEKSHILVTVLKTARVKSEKLTPEMPEMDMKKLFLRIEAKEDSNIMRMFVCYSKERIVRMCHKYYAEYGMTVYEHCEKKRIDPLLVIYIRHMIPSCTNAVSYIAFLIRAYSKSEDGAYMIPYLLTAFMNKNIQAVVNAYNLISVDTLLDTIKKIFDPNIAGYLGKRLQQNA